MHDPNASDAARNRLRALVPDEPGVVTEPMFGNVGEFVHGNMCMAASR